MGSRERNSNDINSWTKALSESVVKTGRSPVGKGWKTNKELKKELGIGKESLRQFLNDLDKAGRLEKFTGSQWSEIAEVPCRQVWYRMK
jgi:hypothetical protein